MTTEKKDIQKSEGLIFSTLKFITESIGWIQIFASPLLIGLLIGFIIYFSKPCMTRLLIGSVVVTSGLIIGVILATKQWKKKGTISFMSRIMSTPELDKSNEENKRKTLYNNE